MRTFLIIDESNKSQSIYVLQASKQDIFNIKNNYTVLDCEEYEGKYYIFDVLILKGVDIIEKSYQTRLDMLKNYVLPNNCIMKEFFQIQTIQDLVIAFQDYVDGIEIDGIILNQMSKSYYKTEAYKLKNKKHLTNDFLLKLIDPQNISNEERQLLNYTRGDVVYKLYCGGNPQDFAYINHDNQTSNQFQAMLFALPYFKVQPTEYMIINKKFLEYVEKMYEGRQLKEIRETIETALAKKYDDVIVECAYNDDLQPYPYRLRQDKTDIYKQTKSIFGNYFGTALSNFNNIMDPITKEYLMNPIQTYFNVDDPDKKYDNLKLFGRQARITGFETSLTLLKKQLKQQSQYLNALDYGAGRNADYYLFLKNDFNTVIAYEPDRKSNTIYYDRMRTQIQHNEKKRKMPLTYIVLDGYAENPVVDQLSINKINFFQSHFVIHYICESKQKILTFKKMLLKYSYNNAIFHFTDNEYFPLLQKNDGLYDNGKYHVKMQNYTKQQADFGQKIEVLMPWISNEMTYEYLVNIKAIQKVFEPEIQLINTIHHIKTERNVSDDDKDYFNCMYTYIFQINKENKEDKEGMEIKQKRTKKTKTE